ncbi:MAG: hypothetical protein ACE5IW_05655 [bacterium]
MVDINLIGDDKGEEKEKEEQFDDFSQTSSLDTQELTFEERTETFDTTKTAGYPLKRGYSSLVSTLIILGVVALLGSAVYFFLFTGDKRSSQADLPTSEGQVEDFIETLPPEAEEPTESKPLDESELETNIEPEPTMEPERRVETTPPSLPSLTESLDPVSSRIVSTSRSSIQTVTDLMSMIPSNLNTTLLSYAGKRVRLEFVAATASEAQNFINLLTQSSGTGNFTVLSESQVATDGKSLEKVLLAGSVAGDRAGLSTGRVASMNLEQTKNWVQNTANQYGLQIRQFQSHQGTFVDGYLRIPILIRVFGSKSAVVGFLEEIAVQGLNVELTKILLVSPDMIDFSDDSLMLVLNLFLYQPS